MKYRKSVFSAIQRREDIISQEPKFFRPQEIQAPREISFSLSLFSLISLLYDRYQDFIHLSRLSKEDLQHLSPITEVTFPGQEVTDYELLPYIRKVMEKVCGCCGDHTDITEPSRKVLLQQHKSTIDRVFIERPMDFILTKKLKLLFYGINQHQNLTRIIQ